MSFNSRKLTSLLVGLRSSMCSKCAWTMSSSSFSFIFSMKCPPKLRLSLFSGYIASFRAWSKRPVSTRGFFFSSSSIGRSMSTTSSHFSFFCLWYSSSMLSVEKGRHGHQL